MSDSLPAGIARYIAKSSSTLDDYPPILLRVRRDEDGYEHEESWRPGTRTWEHSHYVLDDRVGKDNYDDLAEISEQRALDVQEAWRLVVAAQDAAGEF